MRADIFIPTSNRMESLRQCLDSLSLQTNKDFHLIIGGLIDDSQVKNLIESYKDLSLEYFIQQKPGIIGAANEALKKAQEEIFIRIDDDVVIDPKWYENLISTYENDDKIGGVTGPTTMSEQGLKSRDLTTFLEKFKHSRNIFLKLFYRLYADFLYEGKMQQVSQFLPSGVFTIGSNYPEALQIEQNIEVSNLEACNWSGRTEILRKIGGFDEIYVKGLGDYHEADAALKIRQEGYKLIFNPNVRLRHNVEVGKVAKARPAPYYRIQNFIIFYFRFYKIKSFKQFFQFLTNLTLQNGYYIFRFFTTGRLSQLGAIGGTVVGSIKVMLGKHKLITK